MRIELDRTGTDQSFKNIISNMTDDPDIKGIIILSCDANGYTPKVIDPVLKACPVPVSGGIFPNILNGHEILEKGNLVIGLSVTPAIITVNGMSNPNADYDRALYQKLEEINSTETIFVLADGLASRISSFINALFINLGLENNIIGGGAGSLSLQRKPNLLSNAGMLDDSAILTFIPTASNVCISHGWSPIKGPFKVTESDRNIIKSLDWMPAFNIYREAIREHSGQYLTRDNFPELAMSYPFGISRICCEHIIRDPVKLDDDGNLICVGEIREGSFVEIMHGSAESLIEASMNISAVNDRINLNDNSLALMVDCISRALFMEDRFEDELKAVTLPDIPMVGMLSFGEIATKFKESLEFHNKTTVLTILEEM